MWRESVRKHFEKLYPICPVPTSVKADGVFITTKAKTVVMWHVTPEESWICGALGALPIFSAGYTWEKDYAAAGVKSKVCFSAQSIFIFIDIIMVNVT